MSDYSIMSVRDLIDIAFLSDGNVVDFKIIQTILYLLARQMRILGRRVEVNVDRGVGIGSQTSISVTEIKMQAALPKNKKKSKLSVGETTNLKDESNNKSRKIKDNFPEKSLTQKTASGRPGDGTAPALKKTLKGISDPSYDSSKKGYHSDLEKIEEHRERELRVIRQRVNSREEAEKSPTPMASLDSIEMQYEKLLVVERSSSEEARALDAQDGSTKTRKLSIVTQDQFQTLAGKVRELQNRFGKISSADFPENIELMKELRKGASLTDAMAALQMSVRLEAAEKTLKQMLSLITNFAHRTSGLDLSILESGIRFEDQDKYQRSEMEDLMKLHTKDSQNKYGEKRPMSLKSEDDKVINQESPEEGGKSWMTSSNLDLALQELQSEILKEVMIITNNNTESANNALKIAKLLERKLDASSQLAPRMKDLQTLVSDYADQINTLDTGLSAQMVSYQEQLTQMQNDLEIGLENMAEALANVGGDTAVVAELNTNFTNLQEDFDRSTMKQKELHEEQNSLYQDLQGLWKAIEKLREIKPDREEVSDALRDKAGIKALNGLVSQEHFDAVRGDFQKSIGAAYDKFNNQEKVWQKAIDDVFRELGEKADSTQLNSLRDDINKNIEMLNCRIQSMKDILGEPIAAATTRKLFREAACLSCASPANMEITETDTIPKLPAFPQTSTQQKQDREETPKLTGDGDHDLCIPGKPVTHPIDPRSGFCHRYCGGGSVTRTIKKHVPIRFNSALRVVATGIGSDGKTYMIEEHEQPCVPCNKEISKITQPVESDQASKVCMEEVPSSGTTPSDFFISRKEPGDYQCFDKEESVSVTPLLPLDD